MANRTLRRAYNGTKTIAGVDPIESVTNADSNGTTERDERSINVDGTNNVGDTDGVSGIDSIEIDPGTLDAYIARDSAGTGSGDSNTDGTRKRRGRKPGSRNTKSGAKKAQETVEPFLLMAHQWAAVLLKTPEIALSTDEAKQLSDAYATFCEYHEVPIMSPKRMSEINMIASLCLVYGPRFVAVRVRHKEERKAKNARNVTPIAAVI